MYLRKSRAEEGQSTEEVLAKHRAALEELADRLGLPVDGVYEEVASGEKLYARPEMLKLLERIRAGEVEAVLCMDIDRLGRGGMADQGTILDAFRESGTLIITPEKTYDLTNDVDIEMTEFKATRPTATAAAASASCLRWRSSPRKRVSCAISTSVISPVSARRP